MSVYRPLESKSDIQRQEDSLEEAIGLLKNCDSFARLVESGNFITFLDVGTEKVKSPKPLYKGSDAPPSQRHKDTNKHRRDAATLYKPAPPHANKEDRNKFNPPTKQPIIMKTRVPKVTKSVPSLPNDEDNKPSQKASIYTKNPINMIKTAFSTTQSLTAIAKEDELKHLVKPITWRDKPLRQSRADPPKSSSRASGKNESTEVVFGDTSAEMFPESQSPQPSFTSETTTLTSASSFSKTEESADENLLSHRTMSTTFTASNSKLVQTSPFPIKPKEIPTPPTPPSTPIHTSFEHKVRFLLPTSLQSPRSPRRVEVPQRGKSLLGMLNNSVDVAQRNEINELLKNSVVKFKTPRDDQPRPSRRSFMVKSIKPQYKPRSHTDDPNVVEEHPFKPSSSREQLQTAIRHVEALITSRSSKKSKISPKHCLEKVARKGVDDGGRGNNAVEKIPKKVVKARGRDNGRPKMLQYDWSRSAEEQSATIVDDDEEQSINISDSAVEQLSTIDRSVGGPSVSPLIITLSDNSECAEEQNDQQPRTPLRVHNRNARRLTSTPVTSSFTGSDESSSYPKRRRSCRVVNTLSSDLFSLLLRCLLFWLVFLVCIGIYYNENVWAFLVVSWERIKVWYKPPVKTRLTMRKKVAKAVKLLLSYVNIV